MQEFLNIKKILVVIAVIMTSLIITTGIFTIMAIVSPNWILTTGGKLTMQAIQTILLFGITPLIGIKLTEKKDSIKTMALNRPLSWKNGLIVLLFAITALPGISWLAELNSKIEFPPFLSNIEIWMKRMEEAARILTEEFINTSSPLNLVINIFVIALLPAICEEMLFRGWIQRGIGKHMNHHAAIWITAFIFSAIHLQFYGFIPRMIIGGCLGYIYYYTGSLWGSILAHFINNTIAVVTGYMTYNKICDIDFEAIGTGDMWPVAIGSIAIAAILIVKLKGNKDSII